MSKHHMANWIHNEKCVLPTDFQTWMHSDWSVQGTLGIVGYWVKGQGSRVKGSGCRDPVLSFQQTVTPCQVLLFQQIVTQRGVGQLENEIVSKGAERDELVKRDFETSRRTLGVLSQLGLGLCFDVLVPAYISNQEVYCFYHFFQIKYLCYFLIISHLFYIISSRVSGSFFIIISILQIHSS